MDDTAKPAGRSAWVYAALYLASSAVIVALQLTEAIDTTTGLILFVGAMGLLIPMVRSTERKCRANAAIIRYNRRMLAASFGYVLGLGIAVALFNSTTLPPPAVFAIALLPTLPTFVMIWAMARYVIEETDEYLRYRNVKAALISLGLTLAVGIFWGFLETFELAPHVPAWWVLPVWAGGLGVAQLWMWARER
ncbi:hypothetical protein [Porphyrobacter sp. AAP82]|uniref:hypothetical protein n=1 Tax=Porphyrobacter sp. AAP82 TaxID=1248917 RepID=UPI00036169F2|nr:hypothetical protein [Porphyrobacter sp. AAP82]